RKRGSRLHRCSTLDEVRGFRRNEVPDDDEAHNACSHTAENPWTQIEAAGLIANLAAITERGIRSGFSRGRRHIERQSCLLRLRGLPGLRLCWLRLRPGCNRLSEGSSGGG